MVLVSADAPIDRFPSRLDQFLLREGFAHRIVYGMSLAIPGTFHHHKMGGIVLKKELPVFEDICFASPCQVKPCLWIKGIAISGITVFIHSRGQASILIRSYSRK